MKLTISKKTLLKFIRYLRWSKIAAKFASLCTTIMGAVAAVYGSATTGVALGAAGASTYAATKGVQVQGYERTKHVPPGRVDKAANLLRKMEMDKNYRPSTKPKKALSAAPGKVKVGVVSTQQASMRPTALRKK